MREVRSGICGSGTNPQLLLKSTEKLNSSLKKEEGFPEDRRCELSWCRVQTQDFASTGHETEEGRSETFDMAAHRQQSKVLRGPIGEPPPDVNIWQVKYG